MESPETPRTADPPYSMLTDSPPRKAQLARFNESDRIATLPLPPHAAWLVPAQSIEAGMKTGNAQKVRGGCEQFLELLSRFYQVSPCGIRVLASRPLRIRENWSSELFGDYHPSAMAIRVWMRTATSGKRSTQLPCATLPKILAESIPIPQC